MIADFLKQQGNAGIILSIAIILLAGFLCTRVTKRLHFPNVSGYIISGILIGPCVLQMIPGSGCRDGFHDGYRTGVYRLWCG
ncbi:MAG: hypothetical protein ACLSWD_16410 [Clostridium sp.]